MTSQLSNEGVEQGRCLDSLLRPVLSGCATAFREKHFRVNETKDSASSQKPKFFSLVPQAINLFVVRQSLPNNALGSSTAPRL